MTRPDDIRIALLTDGFFPNVIGGMQKHSLYLARYLAAAGVKLDLYYPHFEGKQEDLTSFREAESANITFIPVAYPKKMRGYGHYIREEYEFARRMYSEFKARSGVDFIIAKGFTAWEILNHKSKGMKLPPVGVNFHGYEMFQRQPGFESWLKSKIIFSSPVKFNVSHADYVFSYGGRVTGIIESLGVTRDRILEIPTGISENWLAESPSANNKPRRFVFVGRFERRKGIQELNGVLKKMIASKQEFSFDFIGDIPIAKRISSNKIIYHGSTRDENRVRDILRSCDVLVCPSHSEGMPNVIMEAMASGLAIIATDTGATSVMVADDNGWLIEPANQKALENAIIGCINSDNEILSLKKKVSLEKVGSQFLWPAIASQTIEKIAGILRKSGISHR